MSFIAILGRQPALGLAELESLYGADVITPIGYGAAQINVDSDALQPTRLGGTQKIGRHLTTLPYSDWHKVRKYLAKSLPEILSGFPEGKIKLGLSTYGFQAKIQELNATGLELKKVIKSGGRSARIIANKEYELNSAQVLHGGLLSNLGVELLLIKNGNETIIASTVHVQDIDSYAHRDHGRPARDARVGMLPPKLAQTILNLAIGKTDVHSVLDPFCGTGVLLQEALLAGYDNIGTDLEPRMIESTNKNIAWLHTQYPDIMPKVIDIKVADATTHAWKDSFDTIACETYLGRALSSMPDQETLQKIMNDCNVIHKKFLQNVTRQTSPGFRMCIAVPAWSTKNGFRHLKTLDSLEELGYTRISFVHAKNADLIYHRDGQIVARELVVLIRK